MQKLANNEYYQIFHDLLDGAVCIEEIVSIDNEESLVLHI